MNDMSSEASKLGVECRNVSVESGDLLYIPRGILHAPHTYSCGKQDRYSEPAESLHVSIGIDIYSTRCGFASTKLNTEENEAQMYKHRRISQEKY